MISCFANKRKKKDQIARAYGFEGEEPFLVISLYLLEIYPRTSEKVKKMKLVGREEIKVWKSSMELLLGNYPNFLFV